MSHITTETTRNLIAKAKLPRPPARSRKVAKRDVALRTDEAQALVVGSSLVVAGDGVPAQLRSDIVDCTLFAQLTASGRVTDPSKVMEWYRVYFETLGALGWAQHDRRFEEFQSSGTTLEAHKSIIKVLTALLGPSAAALAIVTESFEALRSMEENSPWITLFNRESNKTRSARFQVATSQTDREGLVEIALVAFDLRSKVALDQILFFKLKRHSTRLTYARGNASIYEAAFKPHRKEIAKRLAEYRAAYIGAVQFPPPT